MFKRELLANKIVSIMLITLGLVSNHYLQDATFLLFAIMLAFPIFISRENWID